MKNLILITIFCLSQAALAGLKSPFPSTVEGVSIKNTHQVDKNLYRGMAPLGKVEELLGLGITDILIFKNQTRSEIDQEMVELDEKGAVVNVTQIDFFWHDYPSYKAACEKTIQALRVMRAVNERNNRKLFFHCTVGEDRTGFLAGIWKMISQNWSLRKSFYYEMCENGYANGNPQKPDYVVGEIREDLSPLFMYMAAKVEAGELTLGNLTEEICVDNIGDQKILYCKDSSRYPEK